MAKQPDPPKHPTPPAEAKPGPGTARGPDPGEEPVPAIGGASVTGRPAASGNADDSSEPRTAAMGPSPTAGGPGNVRAPLDADTGAGEGDEVELDVLRRENDRLKRAADALKPEDEREALKRENEALRKMVGDRVTGPTAAETRAAAARLQPGALGPGETLRSPGRQVPEVFGSGPVLWEGSLPADLTAPIVRFRHTASEAEAKDAYLKHAGISGTVHPVRVAKIEG